jgi:triacylglycerol esterase/lipase EstA (alpha/beta hydrolase family)
MTSRSDDVADAGAKVFPVPMWLLGLLLLCVELSLWLWFVKSRWVHADNGAALAVAVAVLVLAARALVALASYGLSRWKGVAIPPPQRLGAVAWCRFFLVEYWHLCIQNLLLIPFRAAFRTRSERGDGPADGPVVLLQHGYVNNGAVWFFTARALEQQGYRVFTIDQPPFASIDVMAGRLAKRIDEILHRTDAAKLTLVAHSMGGLICRAYLRTYGPDRVAQLITAGTPHHGTIHAYLASGTNGRQMRPGNAWLAALNGVTVDVPFTSIYSVHDTIIAPQDSSAMPGAVNVALSAIGHVSMPSGRVLRVHLLEAMLARPAGAQGQL